MSKSLLPPAWFIIRNNLEAYYRLRGGTPTKAENDALSITFAALLEYHERKEAAAKKKKKKGKSQ